MSLCYQHPERLAVEHCEVCQRALCGSCLWYAESGERLCPDHAAEWLREGKTVHPPERYSEGIAHSEASAARPVGPRAPYIGNSTDLNALLSAAGGVLSLAMCFGLAYFIPLIAFGMGLVSWLQSKDALDPKRTRTLAGVGMVGAAVMLVLVIGSLMLCMVFPFIMAFTAASRSGPTFIPTPLP